MVLVEVATFNSSVEADLALMRLEGAGISATLLDEQMTRLTPIPPTAGFHRVRLMVPEEFAEEARTLLAAPQAEVMAEDGEVRTEDFGESAPEGGDEEFSANEPCPACTCRHTEYVSPRSDPNPLKGLLYWLLLAVPVPAHWRRDNMRCLDCGHTWKLT